MDVSSMLSKDSAEETPKQKGRGKMVSFELLLDEGSKTRARIPLRVKVNPHDDTESIIATVKNFYGIYDGNGVSFEDAKGNTLIASYENVSHEAIVYVRSVIAPSQPPSHYPFAQHSMPPVHELQRRPSLGEPFQMLPPHMRELSHSPSRSSSRLARKRSASPPQARGRRSVSQQKAGSFTAMSRGSSASGSYHEHDGYSDSEAGRSSVSGSRKAKSEQIASSEISTANVLQDGRRGQTIFDSSTLPLFVPPQVPITASQSSISPQRRSLAQEGPSPFHPPVQKLYNMQQPPMLSPQSYGQAHTYGRAEQHDVQTSTTSSAPHGHHLRDRAGMHTSTPYGGRVGYNGQGVLPTPDPTVASCISDEDVARTLIALGDASNYSHGRTSNSTMDETFSGVADAASSTGATSDSDEDSGEEGGLPKQRKYLDTGDHDYAHDGLIKGEFDDLEGPKTKKIKTKMHDGPTNGHRASKSGSSLKGIRPLKSRTHTLPKASKLAPQTVLSKVQSAPTTAAQPRKTSSSSSLNFQQQLGVDEEDLSTKPRCQRCRKSKKGCDRQRPCQRCKDAGIGIEGCVSEDEGNGRKGRFGRHMGVSVSMPNDLVSNEEEGQMLPPAPVSAAAGMGNPDNNKKRKR